MINALIAWTGVLLKFSGVALVFNEVRGLILAAPVLYGIYEAGGTFTAIWIGICSLMGIALSIIVPIVAGNKLQAFLIQRQQARSA